MNPWSKSNGKKFTYVVTDAMLKMVEGCLGEEPVLLAGEVGRKEHP